MPKTELLDRVWPGTFVTDASLVRTVHEIREALGDAADTVRTVHGHGYAFHAEAKEVEAGRSRCGRSSRWSASAHVAAHRFQHHPPG